MMEQSPTDQSELPLPMGVQERTGALLPPLDPLALSKIDPAPSEVLQRGATRGADRLAVSDIEPNNLTDAGWGVIFSSRADPAVTKALGPLIEHRQQQVRDSRVFRIFEGKAGYEPGDTARSWLAKSDVGLAVVDPYLGVPLYLLIVGGPDQIPFEFQYLLDTYWNVGRLAFDNPSDYGLYAARVIAYETALTLPHRRRVAVFATKNPGDRATGLMHDLLAKPLATGSDRRGHLGERQKFEIQALLGESATRENLGDLMRGKMEGVPALLFSGSHGDFLEIGETDQRERQGAIICQNWKGGPVGRDMIFAGDDIPGDATLDGLIHILFACYSGGCPEFDNFRSPSSSPYRISSGPFVARLPQKELTNGALAVLAHVDRAWSYSFLVGRSAPQTQEFRDLMVRIMKGERVGQATDQFNLRWAVLSSELADDERARTLFPGEVSDIVMANRWIARNDARNYLLFGDPAVRLRVEDMST
jgi:hypothetical protein